MQILVDQNFSKVRILHDINVIASIASYSYDWKYDNFLYTAWQQTLYSQLATHIGIYN